MAGFDRQRIALPTGVELDVATAGDPGAPAIVLLHGFPESHRTWRHQIPALAERFFVIAPDQRGFAGSSKPEGVENYTTDKPVADLLALATHFGKERFTLVGHDWGGAVSWMAALQNPQRIERLIIVNAPHPFVYQKSLFDNLDQRQASQYIRFFRETTIDQGMTGAALEKFFDSTFAKHLTRAVAGEDKAAYLEEWGQPGAMTAMFNWYRASAVQVPAMDETPERPAFLDAPFPPLKQPTLVIWGTKDKALLPVQLEGLDSVVPNLTVKKIDAGHFVTWEAADEVTAAMLDWLD